MDYVVEIFSHRLYDHFWSNFFFQQSCMYLVITYLMKFCVHIHIFVSFRVFFFFKPRTVSTMLLCFYCFYFFFVLNVDVRGFIYIYFKKDKIYKLTVHFLHHCSYYKIVNIIFTLNVGVRIIHIYEKHSVQFRLNNKIYKSNTKSIHAFYKWSTYMNSIITKI